MSAESTTQAPVIDPAPAPVTESKEEAAPAVPKPEEPTAVNGDAAHPTGEKNPEAESSKATGEKRDLDDTAGPAKESKVTSQPPPEKKQKTTGKAQPEANKGEAEATNGAKKRGPGRPKRSESKKPQKTPTPRSTEGIGSRTRSRAQA